MSESLYEQIQASAKYLGIDFPAQEVAQLAVDREFEDDHMDAIASVFSYLQEKKSDQIIATQLRMSRLPLKEPKSFENFNFSVLHGKQMEALKALPTLSTLYAHKNLAFIGPQGVGKTHLAMAYGRECCLKGMKVYFLNLKVV